MSEKGEQIARIELTKESACVLGALLTIANNELLGLDRDVSETLEALREEQNLRFSVKLENDLGDFVGAKNVGRVEITCEDGRVTVIEVLND